MPKMQQFQIRNRQKLQFLFLFQRNIYAIRIFYLLYISYIACTLMMYMYILCTCISVLIHKITFILYIHINIDLKYIHMRLKKKIDWSNLLIKYDYRHYFQQLFEPNFTIIRFFFFWFNDKLSKCFNLIPEFLLLK